MRRLRTEEAQWAEDEMRAAELGDARRGARATRMMARAAEHPGGKLTDVMRDKAEMQGAYDLLEEGHVSARALCTSFASATVQRAADAPYVLVAVDGTSLQLTDFAHDKGFGSLGSLQSGARGLKVINALAIDAQGVTIGLLGQVWWARTNAQRDSRDKRKRNMDRPLSDKETRHWIEAFTQAKTAADKGGLRLWFQVDREGDNRDMLLALKDTGHDFTVRSAWDRFVEATGEDKQKLRQRLANESTAGSYEVAVSGAPSRAPRTAHMVVRAACVTLRMSQRGKSNVQPLTLNVVWAVEEGTTPQGEKPLDWLLLTSRSIETFADARTVVDAYTYRWRVEEFHRAWKGSLCRVEETQLRSFEAVTVWATMLANVAARAERLRLLARKQPEQPAGVELSDVELRALILLKRESRARNEVIPDGMPTLAKAVLWIAELGGYTGKSSGGPPGAITIRRGLETLRPAARMLAILDKGHQ